MAVTPKTKTTTTTKKPTVVKKTPTKTPVSKTKTKTTTTKTAAPVVEKELDIVVPSTKTIPSSDNNEQLWAASAYIFFLLPLFGKKTSLTMYHATQGLGYLVGMIAVNIITNILQLRILGGLISLILFIVWAILIISALRKEQTETIHLHTLGIKVIEFLKLQQYFSL